MEFNIYFCVDGILRAQFSPNKPMIPLKFIQDNSGFENKDLQFWSKWWESNVFFEEGLTISNFLFCLEPWANFWSDLTGKKVIEYIQEVRKPISIIKKNEEEIKLDWIGLFYYTEIDAETEYKKDENEDNLMEKDLNKFFNSPKNIRLTGEWNIHSSYKLTGFVNGVEEQYSVDYTPMNELANIPFILSQKQWVYINDWQLPRILNSNKNLFTSNAFGICQVGKESKMNFFTGDKSHNMRDVVEGFFWWLYSTPAKRENFLLDIKKSKESMDEMIEQENNEEQTNVVPLFKQEKEDTKKLVHEEKNEKKLKVKVVPGAFDSLISSHTRDKQFWEEMLELSYKHNNVIIKIGETKLNKEPEKRFFNHIINPKDKKSNPQPTNYKLI